MFFGLLVLFCVTGVTCLPPPVRRSERSLQLTTYDDSLMYNYKSRDDTDLARRELPTEFQHLYVHKGGSITNTATDESNTIEIAASPLTSRRAMRRAAHIVSRMTRHMPDNIFNNIAESGAGAGVFTYAENLTIFPNFAGFKDTPECRGSCKGNCSHSCTDDGRKWEELAGIGGLFGVVVENNLLCTDGDTYHHKESILAHEFSHTIQFHALTKPLNTAIDNAFEAAKANSTWSEGYGMTRIREYWAEASEVFMGVSKLSSWNAAGMNACHGDHAPFCNEMEGRQRLRDKDPNLYDVLVKVYTNGKPELPMGVTVCP